MMELLGALLMFAIGAAYGAYRNWRDRREGPREESDTSWWGWFGT